ncbi:MAG: hypothetical protein ACJATR_002797 [Halopseudomonas sp.]|jgi:hypothetical protein
MRKLALHRCECKDSFWISLDDEIHRPIAEIANTIESHCMSVIHMPLKNMTPGSRAGLESRSDGKSRAVQPIVKPLLSDRILLKPSNHQTIKPSNHQTTSRNLNRPCQGCT